MALACNPAQKVNTLQESFAGYLSNKSWDRFVTCPRLTHYNFSFPYKLQFLLQLFPPDVTPNYLQIH